MPYAVPTRAPVPNEAGESPMANARIPGHEADAPRFVPPTLPAPGALPSLEDLRGHRVGLALAGGGVLAAAHVGALRALDESGITVHAVSGVSAGALVATLWASGLDSRDLAGMTTALGFRDLDLQIRPLLLPWLRHHRPGLIRGHRLEMRLRRLIHVEDLTGLARPCAIVTTDLAGFGPIIFASQPQTAGDPPVTVGGRQARYVVGGPVARILRGSMSVPLLFSPVPYGESLLADGGVAEIVPTDAVRALGADYVIGVDLTPRPEDLGDVRRLSPLDAFARSFRYLQDSVPRLQPDLTIRPHFGKNVSILDFRRQEACMQAGYEAARDVLLGLPARPEPRSNTAAAAIRAAASVPVAPGTGA